MYEQNDSIDLAIDNYNNSLRVDAGGDKQKTFTYERLGNLRFKNSEYIVASSYYDSLLTVATDTLSLRIRRIKRKRKNLSSLIKFENTVKVNDSIIRIASMSKDAQKIYFQNYIDSIKKRDEELAQLRLNQQAFGNSFGGASEKSAAFDEE